MNTQKLTPEEIERIDKTWYRSTTSYLAAIVNMSYTLEPYFEKLKDHDVFEIGPGVNPIKDHFPCKSYESASGFYPEDGLSVLRTKADNSLVIVSFGVIDDSVLYPYHNRENQTLYPRYINELIAEIKRVSNPFAIIFGEDAELYMGKADVLAIPLAENCGGVYFKKH